MKILIYGNDVNVLSEMGKKLRDDGHDVGERQANQFALHCVEQCDKVILLTQSAAIREAYGDKVEMPDAGPDGEPAKAMTVKEIIAALVEKGIEHDPKAKKADLLALLENPPEPEADPGQGAESEGVAGEE